MPPRLSLYHRPAHYLPLHPSIYPHLHCLSSNLTSPPSPSPPSSSPPPSLHHSPPSSPHHSSLPTFLTHATRTSLSPTSTLYIGTHYEYLCQASLRGLSFSLTRTGGRSDHGIDLLGRWYLPSTSLPVLVQCKATKAKAGPEMIRELEGAVMAGSQEGTVGMLCGKGEVTRGVREAVRGSRVGVMWAQICDRGRVRQIVWNRIVGEAVGVEVGLRYVRDGEGWGKEAVLTWKGEIWEPTEEEEGLARKTDSTTGNENQSLISQIQVEAG